ncbi:MAG TPA: hypothetical protein VGC06_22745 [Actinomycetes bacterium]
MDTARTCGEPSGSPLGSRLVDEALDAIQRRPMRQRIADAAPDLLGTPT